MPLEVLNDDLSNVVNSLKPLCGGPVELAPLRSQAFSNIWTRERERFILNATTITLPPEVQRVAVLNETVRAYAQRVIALRVLATVWSNVPLQGTDEIEVQYLPLQAGASKDFDPATGYVFDGTATQQSRKITVDKRKYQAIDYSSATMRRQPFFKSVELGALNAEKLAVDVLFDILSVVTVAKFGAEADTWDPAAVDSDNVIDLKKACDEANWSDQGRGLIVDSTIDNRLQKDEAYKLALNIGGTEVIRQGKLPQISGFDYAWMPSFPDNGEKLVGVATHMGGIGCAFCPVDPVAEVRSVISAYEIVTEPQTGISMNYRAWGNAQMDRAYQVIETAYGKDVINAAGIKRIVKP